MWSEQKRWSARLRQETEVMNSRFPQFVLKRTPGSRRLYWEGVVEPIEGIFYRVALKYPDDFPFSAPTLWVVEPKLQPGAPHIYSEDGEICVYKNNWRQTGSAASTVPLACAWLALYSQWRATGVAF